MDFFSNIFVSKEQNQTTTTTEGVTSLTTTTTETSLTEQISSWGSNLFSTSDQTSTATTQTNTNQTEETGPSFKDQFLGIFSTSASINNKPIQEDFSYVKHIGEIPETCQKAEVTKYHRQSLRDQVFDDEWEAFLKLKETTISKQFTDEFLMACLFSKKLDVPRVEQLLQSNLNWRTNNNYLILPEWESLNKELLLSNFAMKIPGARTKKGEGIVYITMRNLIPRNFPPFIDHAIKWVLWHGMRASLWENLDYFRNGVVVIADLSEMGWDNLDLENATKMGSSFIDNFPMRLSKIILIKPPWLISTVLDAFRLFMKKKIMDRIIAYDSHLPLLEFVEPDNLHSSYGGTLEYSIPDYFKFLEEQLKEEKEREKGKQNNPVKKETEEI